MKSPIGRDHGSAFDTIADTYDDTFTHTAVGRYQRAVVTDIMKRRFQAGAQVLEIGCGTGVDTVFLAQRGVSVTAIDVSSRMVDLARRRVAEAGVHDRVDIRVGAAEQLGEEYAGATFDGLLSNFGVLNCLADPAIIGRLTARCLKPGGMAVFCLFGRWCAWEMLAHMARGRFRTAFRRLGRDGAEARVGDGTVHVIYPSPQDVIAACSPYCAHLRTTGVGVLIPPSYLAPLVCRFPRFFEVCRDTEKKINHRWPFNHLGDHYCLELQRMPVE